jgi:hypothetical protein
MKEDDLNGSCTPSIFLGTWEPGLPIADNYGEMQGAVMHGICEDLQIDQDT